MFVLKEKTGKIIIKNSESIGFYKRKNKFVKVVIGSKNMTMECLQDKLVQESINKSKDIKNNQQFIFRINMAIVEDLNIEEKSYTLHKYERRN